MKHLLLMLLACSQLWLTAKGQTTESMRHIFQPTPSPAGAIPYGNNAKAGRYANAGDARIYYEVYGKGKPFVLLHGGILGSTYELHQFIDSLSRYYQVIAVSTRGHGRSEIGKEQLTYEQKANDVMAVIRDVTRDSVLVLGFSDGGYTGYKLASMYPGKVQKLITIGAGTLYPGMRPFNFTTQWAFSLDTAYWKQQLAIMPEPKRLQEWFTRMSTFYSNLTVGKELLQTIKCPVLVMAGERDQNAPLETVLSAYKLIPNHQLSIIPNAGHGVFLENFPAVWASIVPFLK